jgi:hypothetical protein
MRQVGEPCRSGSRIAVQCNIGLWSYECKGCSASFTGIFVACSSDVLLRPDVETLRHRFENRGTLSSL